MKLNEILIMTSIEMLNFLLAYIVVFGAKLRKEKIYIFGTYILGLLIQTIVYFVSNIPDSIITTIYWLVIPVCWFERRKGKWFALYPFIFVGMSVINISFSFIMAIAFNISEVQVIKNIPYRIICECFGIVILLVILMYQKIMKSKVIEVTLSWKQYLLLFTGLFCSINLVAGFQAINNGEKLPVRYQNVVGILLVMSCVIFIALCLWQGIIMYQRLQDKNKMEKYEEFMKMQEEQIHNIIDRDEQMRKFRHDMNSHMAALRGSVEEKDYDKMLEYLDEIERHSYIKKEIIYTGDSAVDAVYRDLLENAYENEITVENEINISSEYLIKSFDFCIIISNLFKNAIEACEKIDDKDRRKIVIKIYTMDNYLQMIIKNSVSEKVEIINNELRTKKSDKRYHGIGSENIRQTVEKYNGSIEYSCDENVFSAEIFLQMY